MSKLQKKDYFLVAEEIFERLLEEQPDFSDYLPQLIDWCSVEIRKIDSQKEKQRIKRQITNINRKNEEVYPLIESVLTYQCQRPKEVYDQIKDKVLITEEQVRYRLQEMCKRGLVAREQVKSLVSGSMVWGYKRLGG